MSRRENTCNKRCPFWTRYGRHCPNYVEGEWKSREGEKYPVKDCAPKRSMILTQQMYEHIIGVRRDYNQFRNASTEVLKLAAQTVGVELIVEGEIEAPKQITEETTDNG
jgi:hypothetical protein